MGERNVRGHLALRQGTSPPAPPFMSGCQLGTHLRAVAYRMLDALSHRSSFARHYYAPVTTLTERDEGMRPIDELSHRSGFARHYYERTK